MTGQEGKYTFHCGDVIKGCSWQASATSKDELVAKVEEHGMKDHHITNIDPETRHKVEGAIHQQAA